MSGRSTTGSKTACVPTSSSACSPIISNGTCASAWPPCSTTTPTRRPPRRSARARSQRLSDRPPPSPSRPPAEPTMVSPSTASTPCFTTSPPSPKTPSRPPSRPTSPSQSPHGRHTSRKKPPTSWASVPSNTPIQLDLIKLEQWVAKVERGKLRLERQLKKGDKSLVGNKGYRRFLATPGDDHFAIDRAKAEEDAKFDGVFILRTNSDLSPLEAMLCYKNLWMVERAFRTSKSLFATRPIFHKLDETIRGHVSCSFLALVLKKELEDRIANMGKPAADSDDAENGSWPDVLADLDSLTETEVEQDGKRFLLRSAPRPAASLALRAAGVALPPTVRQLADA